MGITTLSLVRSGGTCVDSVELSPGSALRAVEAFEVEADSVIAQIDPYGNTYLNRLQIPEFIEGWAAIVRSLGLADGFEDRAVRAFADRVLKDGQLLLKFTGE